MADTHALTMNHVGVSVPDIDAAVSWYRDTLGFTVLMEAVEVRNDGSHFGTMAAEICGPRFGGMKLAHMASGDGVGLELFQFIEPAHERRADTMEYWKNGFFHLALTHRDVPAMVQRIVEAGGKQRSQVWTVFEGEDVQVCYCEDPFGNVLEIISHRYEQIFANRSA